MATQSSPRGLIKRSDPRPTPYHRWDPQSLSFVLVDDAAEQAVQHARDLIDATASRARGRYLSNGVGQDATYTAKYLDALNYIKAGYPQPPTQYAWVAAEAAATGLTPAQAADRIAAIGSYWHTTKGPEIEGVRIAGKDALGALTTVEDIIQHTATVVSALDAL